MSTTSPARSLAQSSRMLALSFLTWACVLLAMATAFEWARSHYVTHQLEPASWGRWRVNVQEVGTPTVWIFHDERPVQTPAFYFIGRRSPGDDVGGDPTFLGWSIQWRPAEFVPEIPNAVQSDMLALHIPYWSLFILFALLPTTRGIRNTKMGTGAII
jgi:hypothetical protein